MTEREKQQLAKITEKMEQMKAREKAILAREKERQRKDRTHRLIQRGALVEKYFDCENMPMDEFEKMLIRTVNKLGNDNR